MTDVERGRGSGDEDRLPWLEAVEDEEERGAPGVGRLVAAVIVALAVIGLTVGGVFWLRDRNAHQLAAGEGELIPAPPGAYKTKPGDPGGMKVEGQGDTAYAASEGKDADAAIDLSKLPETPVTEGNVTSADAAAAAPKAAIASGKVPTGPTPPPAKVAASTGKPPAPAAPAPVKTAATPPAPTVKTAAAAKPAAAPAPVAPAAGGTIQLGAFSSEAKANAAWKTLSGRFAFLSPLTSAVTPVKTTSATLYRLRATAGGQAASVCAKLKVAGETCAVVG